ncbi:MAG: hypothetical protein FD130_1241, partial [Halothiobacillaceae bacterium]
MRMTQRWPTLLALALVISGCGTTQPAKFYLLTPTSSAPKNGSVNLNVGLGPMVFPAYLEHNRIMTRTGTHSLEAAASHHWAEPL